MIENVWDGDKEKEYSWAVTCDKCGRVETFEASSVKGAWYAACDRHEWGMFDGDHLCKFCQMPRPADGGGR